MITLSEFLRPSDRMHKIARFLVILVTVLALVLPAAADKASSLYAKGQDAEARQDYQAAYNYYSQAYQLMPKNTAYRSGMARMRFEAASAHVHTGQQLRDAGKLQEAMIEFQKAQAIDPSLYTAQQEIRRTQAMIDAAKSKAAGEVRPQTESLKSRLEASGGVVELQPISGAPITLKLTEDSKVVYETIGKLAGINVVFDPDYTAKRIHIELNAVTLPEALELVALESKTFWRPVTANTIFVAGDTPAKRKELEQNVVRTFYLTNLSQPTELQDVVNTLRTILEVNRITQIPSQGAIVVRGTPDQVELAEKLVDDLDKAKPEVIIDVDVLVVNRDKSLNLGLTPPSNVQVALQSNVNNSNSTTNNNTSSTSTTSTTSTSTTASNTGLTLNQIGQLTANDFLVTIPTATANFLMGDSSTKIVQNPQIRALDGQKASLKIGERVPVATGSFGAGVGGVGVANTLVNTQFQYLDVGVNIDVTPKVHANGEVSLKLMMDISAVDSETNIGGIEQPVIGQRKIEHDIRLKEGESNLVGGILEDQDVKNISGFPLLMNIPIFKYLFSSKSTDKSTNELVFIITPHIVRGQELSTLNTETLDVGTSNTIALRHVSMVQPKPAAVVPAVAVPAAVPPVTAPPIAVPPAAAPPAAVPPAAVAPAAKMPATAAASVVAAPAAPSVAKSTATTASVPATPPVAAPASAATPPSPARVGAQTVAAAVPPANIPGGVTVPTGADQHVMSAQPTSPAATPQAAVLSFSPATITTTAGQTFMVDVVVSGAQDLFTVPVQIQYDPTKLQVANVSNGGFLGQGEQAVALAQRDDSANGMMQVTANRPPNSGGVSGEGSVFTITFMAKESGQTSVAVTRAGLRDVNNKSIPVAGTQAAVSIKERPQAAVKTN